MAAATYVTDLATVNVLDSDANPAVGEPTGSTAGTTIGIETDHYVVGTACINKIYNATGVGGLGFQNATAVTVPTDGAVYMWTYFGAPGAISSKTAGGMQLLVGNTLANYKRYYVYGADTIPYGGWQVNAVDPSQTASATQGTPSGTWQYFGIAVNVLSAVARGYPLCWDAVRSGRGLITITAGDLANGYANFNSCATEYDTNTTTGPKYYRWGIFSFGNGTYTLQGKLALGSSGTAVDFRDSNRVIFVKNNEYVSANFNLIEVVNAASRVDWTGISISALGTVSKGRFLMTNNATVNMVGCTFTDMSTFVYQSNAIITGTVFRRCELVTAAGATFTNCTFDQPSAAAGLLVATPANLSLVTKCSFTSDGTGYGIELTGTAANCTLDSVVFSGYAAYQAGGTTTGNEAIFVNISTGNMTINITGTGNTPSFRTAGATVTVSNSKNLAITDIVTGSDVVITSSNTNTVLVDIDQHGATTYNYSYVYAINTYIDIKILKAGYVPYMVYDYLLGSSDASLPVSQVADRNYLP